jgi:two-component system cell cycle sensor histidine kinase/response regulator CckA
MSQLRPPVGDAPPSARHSLRWRLPLIISSLVAGVIALFVWAAHREVQRTLIDAGVERAQAAADQLGTILSSSARQRLAEQRRLAADPLVARFLRDPTDQTDIIARGRLASLVRPGRQAITLWGADGTRLISLVVPGDATELAPTGPPSANTPIRLFEAGGVVFSDTVEPVVATEDDANSTVPLGWLSVRRPVTMAPAPDIFNRLVGGGAVVLFGAVGDLAWTDLTRLVVPPPVDVSKRGSFTYEAAQRDVRLGSVGEVSDTPWRVWVEFPMKDVVAPGQRFLRSTLIVALALVWCSVILVALFGWQVTRPLVDLTRAAEAFTAGDYKHRVDSDRRDEIGRLTRAFNTMGGQIEGAQQRLMDDLQERTQMEAALVESERAYRSTFDEAPVGIAHMSLEGAWVRVNRHLADLLGYSAEELVSRQLSAVQAPEAVAHDRELREQLLNGGLARAATETRYRHREGHLLRLNVTVSLHRDLGGQPQYFIAILEDISERRALEEQLSQAQKMEAVGRLAGGVAHDFNNLLTAILGYSNLVLDELEPNHPARVDVQEMKRAGESAAALTQQLLAFSRKQILQPQVLDLNEVVTRADSLLQRLIGEHIALVTSLDRRLDHVSADPGQLEQVILNLALNARDAMPAGGKLTIETANVDLDDAYVSQHGGASPGPHVMLAVSDTGVGMDAATQARIFEPFFTTKRRGEGTGLGLATVHGIVNQSGGSIWVYSEPGRGTTFKVYFPRAPHGERPPAAAPARTEALGGSETVLLAEDQPEVRSIACTVLRRYGYRVLEAADGDEALRIVRAHREPIHVLLSDVVMPSMSGPELAHLVQLEHPGIRVLYASGYTDDAIVRHGVLDPGVAFLQKPFTPTSLLRKIRELLDASTAAGT